MSVDFGVFAVAGVGAVLLGVAWFVFRRQRIEHWRSIKGRLVDFLTQERGRLPAHFRPIVGAFGMYLKLRHENSQV